MTVRPLHWSHFKSLFSLSSPEPFEIITIYTNVKSTYLLDTPFVHHKLSEYFGHKLSVSDYIIVITESMTLCVCIFFILSNTVEEIV